MPRIQPQYSLVVNLITALYCDWLSWLEPRSILEPMRGNQTIRTLVTGLKTSHFQLIQEIQRSVLGTIHKQRRQFIPIPDYRRHLWTAPYTDLIYNKTNMGIPRKL